MYKDSGNVPSDLIIKAVEPLVEHLVLAHPQRVKATASAKLKNDWMDSATLAHLLRANLLPEAWRVNPQHPAVA